MYLIDINKNKVNNIKSKKPAPNEIVEKVKISANRIKKIDKIQKTVL